MVLFNKLSLWRIYFIRGHTQYLAIILSLFNFIVIQFQLLWQNILENFGIFINIFDFAIIFSFFYFPLIILVGRWDYKNHLGSFQTEHQLHSEISPVWQKTFAYLKRIEEKLD